MNDTLLSYFKLADKSLLISTPEHADIILAQIPTNQDKNSLFPLLPIAQTDILAALDSKEIGRVDFNSDYSMLIIKIPENTNKDKSFSLEINTLGIFMTPTNIILVTSHRWIDLDISSIHGATSLTAFVLKVIVNINHHFQQHLRVIHQALNEWEQEIGETMDNQYFQHVYKLQKGLVFYVNALDGNHKLVEKIAVNKAKFKFTDECSDILDDLLIDTLQTYQQAKDYTDILGGLSQTMAAIMNNQLSERLKKLTLISICVMVPTLVVSLFSMNVDLPIVQHGSTQSFWLILTFATLSVVFISWLWNARKW